MAELGNKLQEIKKMNKKAFVTYLCAGDPEEKLFLKITRILSKYVDIFEIGIPFTDSVADGPVIQNSIARSLQRGMNTNKIYTLCKKIMDSIEKPVVIMTSYNIIHRRGMQRFIEDSIRTGIKGLIIPDLPIEEADEYCYLAKDRIDTIFLATPASGIKRFKTIVKLSTGFIYYVSVKGITGIREKLPVDIKDNLNILTSLSKEKPVYVGFGISNPLQVREIIPYCDGIIVGSKIIKIIEDMIDISEKKVLKSIEDFIYSIRAALEMGK
ncbi:MAG: tryptophan synthase subunit alpha [Candidatus Hydrogenedentota bacterium]